LQIRAPKTLSPYRPGKNKQEPEQAAGSQLLAFAEKELMFKKSAGPSEVKSMHRDWKAGVRAAGFPKKEEAHGRSVLAG
jgi:hypothetical protein